MEIALIKDAPAAKAAGFEPEEILSFREIIAIFQRHRKLILFSVAAGLMLGGIYIMFSAPRYTTTASLLIDPRQSNPMPQMLDGGISLQENLIIDSQIEVIKSTHLMDKVAKKLGLYDSIENVQKTPLARLKEMIVGAPDAAKLTENVTLARQRRLEKFMNGLSVGRVRNTYVIAIDYTSGNPQEAAKIANTIADVYLDDELEAQYEASQRANDWLKLRLGVLQKELATSETDVETYKSDNGIIQTQDNHTLLTDQQLSELNSNLIVAKAETAQAKARYDNIEDIIKSGNPETATSDILNNKEIMDLRGKYIELSRMATEILRKQGKDHLIYRNLIQQMADIQKLIWGEYTRIAESYKSEYEISESKQDSLQKAVDEAKGTTSTSGRSQIALRELERKADSTRNLYTKMLDRSNEESERQSLPSVHARVISSAAAPLVPSWPNKRLVLMASLFIGGVVGVGLAFVREQFEKFIWKAEDLEAAAQRTCLGMLPKIAFDREKVVHFTKRWSTKELSVTELPSREFNQSGFSEVTQLLEKQTGIITEIMRNVQLATQFSKDHNRASDAKVISFVSARPGEGKSITSCFLAKHLAKTGARVALVDCDFRRPSLSHWFLPGAQTGFYELASRIGHEDQKAIAMDIAAVCHQTGQENLFFIPAKGANTSIQNLNLVSSGQMHVLITYLKQIFDVVLIDLPPIMNIVDARVIANSIDSFILLAHWGKTDRGVVSKSLHRAPEVHNKTVGALLTLVDTEKASRYGYYNYNYYYYYHHQSS